MNRTTLAGLAAGALALGTTLAAGPAHATTTTDTYPDTPRFDPVLPIIHTTHLSDHLKANVLTPHPVCNAGEDFRTVVYKVTDDFLPVGTISTTNQTSQPVPLTQETSRSQTISLSVNGNQTSSVSGNLGGSTGTSANGNTLGGQAGIAFSLARTIGGTATYSLSWNVAQKIGPYQVDPGHTGEATYGFRAVTMKGTQQFCLANGTWSTPTAWSAFAPIKNEVRVRTYDTPSGAIGGVPNPQQAPQVPATHDDAGTVATPPADSGATGGAHDLTVGYTVSGAKVPGAAGLVAIHVKNVGTQRYYAEFPAVSFRVDVKTASGPQGVDRLITPGWFHGAYTQDLGFDEQTSTRSFLVTLANPVEPGEDQVVANLDFGDGLTKLGRITNRVEVSQVGRLADDTSTGNDQAVDSRTATRTDTGGRSNGLF